MLPQALILTVIGVFFLGSFQAQKSVQAVRFSGNPLVTVDSGPSLGGNIDGPSLIRVPDWVERPLGRYYLYFAHHRGSHIRLAYADSLQGPWKIHEAGVLHVRSTAFYRPQPDPVGFRFFYTHIASPEVLVDHKNKRIVMYFHGYWTEGKCFPRLQTLDKATAWIKRTGYGQHTQAATSRNGLHFEVHPVITKRSYLRVVSWGPVWLGMGRGGQLLRSDDLLSAFEIGPNPFVNTAYANRVRHVALLRRENTLFVFFSAIGDEPERILVSSIDLEPDWSQWRASAPVTVLKPEKEYECADLPITPSELGDISGPAHQLRDPAIFEEGDRVYLFYSFCGEQGIGGAEVSLSPRQ